LFGIIYQLFERLVFIDFVTNVFKDLVSDIRSDFWIRLEYTCYAVLNKLVARPGYNHKAASINLYEDL